MCVCLLTALLLDISQASNALSRSVLDDQFGFLHRYEAHPVTNDVVIVGIDEDSYKAFKEPFALWHPYLGKFLQAMAIAKPAVVGLDIVLPERSYEFLIPRYDQSLLQGLLTARAQTPLVLVARRDAESGFTFTKARVTLPGLRSAPWSCVSGSIDAESPKTFPIEVIDAHDAVVVHIYRDHVADGLVQVLGGAIAEHHLVRRIRLVGRPAHHRHAEVGQLVGRYAELKEEGMARVQLHRRDEDADS